MDPQDIGDNIRQLFGEDQDEFRPFAYFNVVLDRLGIITRDCSVLEIARGPLILFEDNYPEDGGQKYVGIALDGASRITGLPPAQLEAMAAFLDKIAATCSEDIEAWVNELAERF